LLLVAFLLVNAPNCHLSLVIALVVQGDAVNCNTSNLAETVKRPAFWKSVPEAGIVNTNNLP